MAVVLFVVELLLITRYGYFSDELYFLAAGDHLSFGYADQGPALPLIALAMQTLAPDSLLALRIPPLLATIGYLLLAALTCRELGGARIAQTCAAAACATAEHFLVSAHHLVTASFDQLLWAWIIWLLVRWVRRHREDSRGNGLLIGAGVLTALALQVKVLIPALWLVVLPTAALFGPRAMLRRPGLWAGAALAVLAAVPNLWWQATHGWPQLKMTQVIGAETAGFTAFLKSVFFQVGLAGALLTGLGVCALLFHRRLRPYRFLGAGAVALTILFGLLGGRAYYMAGFYALLFAAGAVTVQWWWQRHRERRLATRSEGGPWRSAPVRAGIVGIIACYAWTGWTAAEVLPIAPVSSIEGSDVTAMASRGWEAITASVAGHYHSLPSGQQDTAVIAHDYWSASAIHHFGPEFGLPRVYSPSRGFWYFGRPTADVERVMYLGSTRRHLERLFGSVRKLGTIDTHLATPTYYEGTPIWLVHDPKMPWPRLWSRLRHMSLWG